MQSSLRKWLIDHGPLLLVAFAALWAMMAASAYFGDRAIPSLRRGCEELRQYHSVKTGQTLGDEAIALCQEKWRRIRTRLILEMVLVTFGPSVPAFGLGLYLMRFQHVCINCKKPLKWKFGGVLVCPHCGENMPLRREGP